MAECINVLIVEDDEAHAELVEAAFEDERSVFDIIVKSSLAEAREQIKTAAPDIIITDINLPDGKGSDLVPQEGDENTFPVIVMTSYGNEQLAVETMKLGVMDYIVKSNHTMASLPHIAKRAFGEWKAKQQKIEAEKKSAQLVTALSKVGESIIITDAEGRITYTNPFFEKMTGYSSEEVIGEFAGFLNDETQGDSPPCGMRESIVSGKVWKGTIVNRKKDGTRFEAESIVTPITDDSGEVVSCVTVKRDVTNERLLEKQYFQSQKMAAIGQFAQKVVHDFTNALNVILGNNELIIDMISYSPQALQYTNNINSSVNKIAKLISQLLAFSHPSEPMKESIKLNFVIKGLSEILEKALPANIEKVINLDADCERVSVDISLIEQAIVHLAINSAEAMPDGGTLTISTESNSRRFGEKFESIAISDNGCGMDEEQQRRIFEPFFSTKEKGKNSGLGLSTVFKIIEQHNGRIIVESSLGRGTKITILLPKESEDDPTAGKNI